MDTFGGDHAACFTVAVGAVGVELGPRGAGREPRRLGLRWSGDNLDWTWGLDWTGPWTGLEPGLELTIGGTGPGLDI